MEYEKNDRVICCYCDTEQVVEKGSDVCLACGKTGYLKWIDSIKESETNDIPHIINDYGE